MMKHLAVDEYGDLIPVHKDVPEGTCANCGATVHARTEGADGWIITVGNCPCGVTTMWNSATTDV